MKGGKTKFLLVGLSAFLLATNVNASQEYSVRPGDTLWGISKRFGVSIDTLKSVNQISDSKPLPIGKKLIVSTDPVATPKEAVAESDVCHTNGNNVILRSGPGKTSNKIRVLPRGTTLTILEKSEEWSKVSTSDSITGWVFNTLLSPGAGTVATCPAAAKSTASAGEQQSALIKTALANRGARYSYGGTSRSGFDCSGFTRYIYAQYGVSLPHSSRAQFSHGKAVSKGELKEGDLVFFCTTRRGISHVGIYIGDGKFVHASNRSRGVVVDSLNAQYYSTRYVGARRVK